MEHSAEGGSNPAKQPHEIEPEGQRGGRQKGGREHRIGGKYAVRLHIFGHDEAGHGGGRTGHNENGDHLAVPEAHGSGQRQENGGAPPGQAAGSRLNRASAILAYCTKNANVFDNIRENDIPICYPNFTF